MFSGINHRDMAKAMKKLGIKQDDLNAKRAVITLEDKELVFENPQVLRVDMAGQETYQITGDFIEKSISSEPDISDEDIKTVAEQANCSMEKALEAISRHKGDLAGAIMELNENSSN